MRTLTLLCLGLLLSFSLYAQQIEQRKIGDFDRIEFEGRGEILLSQSDTPSLELETGDDVNMKRVKTYVQGNTLHISYERENDKVWDMHPKIIVYLTYRDLREINTQGIVDVKTEDPIRSTDFRFIAEGMGNSALIVDVNSIEVNIAGTASIELKGSADRGHLTLDGTGEIDAFQMVSVSVDAEVNGTGSLFVNASERLHVEANGFGAQVKYKGNPKDKVINKSGWVSVKQVNSR